MQLRLLEIELNTEDPEASKHFYSEQLGLETYVDEDGFKVYGGGDPYRPFPSLTVPYRPFLPRQ